jgi:hypothetical protein
MTEVLERCDGLAAVGVRPYIKKTVPFTLEAVAQAVEESGTGKHLGKCGVKF